MQTTRSIRFAAHGWRVSFSVVRDLLCRRLPAAVVRITTNLRSYPVPSSLPQAFAFCDNLLSQPHCEIVEAGERHWSIFRRLCVDTKTTGRRVTDAWYAALAIEHGCEWITLDRDFARFPGLRWAAPSLPA